MLIEKETIPKNWQIKSFNELLQEPVSNGVYKQKEFHGRGVKIINMGELFKYDFISNQEMQRVELTDEELKRYLVRDGDLLFARRSLKLEGSGKCSYISNPSEDTTFESSMIRARVNRSVSNPKYYYYFFHSPLGRASIASIASRTAVSGIRGSELMKLKVPLPPRNIQDKIAFVLSFYDDFIENNNHRIKILEEMARLIYKEWFVKFRFPGHEKVKMVESELGMIPEGWEVKSILDIESVNLIKAKVKRYDGVKEYFATANVEGNNIIKSGELVTYNERPSRAQMQPEENTIWFAKMRETFKVLCFTSANKERAGKSILSSGFAGFKVDKDKIGFFYFTICSERFHALKDQYCTGATQMSSTIEGLSLIKIILPEEILIKKYNNISLPAINQIILLQQQNKNLRQTRDMLLPKLIKGEMDVSGLDIAVKENI